MTETLLLRHADGDQDILASFTLMQQLRPHLTGEADYLARVRRQAGNSYRLLLAWQNDRPVGLAGYRQQENLVYGRFLYIDDLVTLPDVRGTGIGERLLAACREEARSRHCTAMVLDTRRDNVLAQRFYFRNGMLPHAMRFSLPLSPTTQESP